MLACCGLPLSILVLSLVALCGDVAALGSVYGVITRLHRLRELSVGDPEQDMLNECIQTITGDDNGDLYKQCMESVIAARDSRLGILPMVRPTVDTLRCEVDILCAGEAPACATRLEQCYQRIGEEETLPRAVPAECG